jgi:hypothetical protein
MKTQHVTGPKSRAIIAVLALSAALCPSRTLRPPGGCGQRGETLLRNAPAATERTRVGRIAPRLASNRVHAQPPGAVARLHPQGAPASGMPGFDLPDAELDALAALMRSLNAPAAEAVVSGDSAAGKESSTARAMRHLPHGFGRRAPGWSRSVQCRNEMTAEEIRAALVEPSAQIAPGFERVTVRLKDGRTLRGFVKNRSNFDIGLQDLEGRFYSLRQEEISAIEEEKESLMSGNTTAENYGI